MQSMISLSFGNPAAAHDFSEILLMTWPYTYEINNCLSSIASSGCVRLWDFGVASSEVLTYPNDFHASLSLFQRDCRIFSVQQEYSDIIWLFQYIKEKWSHYIDFFPSFY